MYVSNFTCAYACINDSLLLSKKHVDMKIQHSNTLINLCETKAERIED